MAQHISIKTLLIFVPLIFSCSSVKEKIKEVFNQNNSESPKVTERLLNLGPTSAKENLIFRPGKSSPYHIEANTIIGPFNIDSEIKYHFFIFPEFFSRPQHYQFNPKDQNFEKVEGQVFFPEFKGSFLSTLDLDKTGIPYFIVGGLNQRSELSPLPLTLYKGKKLKTNFLNFEKTAELPLNAGAQSSMALVDFDLDGDLDLFVAQWYDVSLNTQGHPQIDTLLETENGKFTVREDLLDFNLKVNESITPFPTFSVLACDINRDGYPDILTASTDGYPNRLWLNSSRPDGKRYFKEMGALSHFAQDDRSNYGQLQGGRSFSLDCADFNRDGIVDLFVGELSYSYDSEFMDRSSVLFGKSKEFLPSFNRLNLVGDLNQNGATHCARKGTFIDLDMDGDYELTIDNSGFPPHGRFEVLKYTNGKFQNIASELGVDILNPSSSHFLDLNLDGKLDLLIGQTNIRTGQEKKYLYSFLNHEVQESISLHLLFEGKKSNKEAYGTQIVFKTNLGRELYYENKSPHGSPPILPQSGIWVTFKKGEYPIQTKMRWPKLPLKWVPLDFSKFHDNKTYKLKICEGKKAFTTHDKKCP